MNVQFRFSVAQLKQIPLLSDLPDAAAEDLIKAMRYVAYSKGNYAVRKGDQSEDLFFILRGRLLVVDETVDGRQVGLNFLTPGDFFGELSVIDDLPRSASVVAVAPSIIGVLPKVRARSLIYETPVVAEKMLKHIAYRLRASTDYRSILGIPQAFARVAALVQLLSKPDAGRLLTIENMPTHQHLAVMINSSRETVSRAMQALIERGVLEKDNRRLIIREPSLLARLVQDPQAIHDGSRHAPSQASSQTPPPAPRQSQSTPSAAPSGARGRTQPQPDPKPV
jgi:CRP-like cAMP-binding protein